MPVFKYLSISCWEKSCTEWSHRNSHINGIIRYYSLLVLGALWLPTTSITLPTNTTVSLYNWQNMIAGEMISRRTILFFFVVKNKEWTAKIKSEIFVPCYINFRSVVFGIFCGQTHARTHTVSKRTCTELFVEPCHPSQRYCVTAASSVGSTEHTGGPTLQTDHIWPSSIFCCGSHSVEQSSCRI